MTQEEYYFILYDPELNLFNQTGKRPKLEHLKMALAMFPNRLREFLQSKTYRKMIPIELIDQILELEPNLVTALPDELQTKERWEKAISLRGKLIMCAPSHIYMDRKMCLLAVKQDPEAIRHLPTSCITKEVCEAVCKNPFLDALAFIPDQFKTLENCVEAVKHKPFNFTYVPDPMRKKVAECLYKSKHWM